MKRFLKILTPSILFLVSYRMALQVGPADTNSFLEGWYGVVSIVALIGTVIGLVVLMIYIYNDNLNL